MLGNDRTKNCKIEKIWPMANNTMASTIMTTGDINEEVVKMGSMTVELVWCKVKKRYAMRRSNKCWKYEHIAKDCSGVDRRSTGEVYCTICNEKGYSLKVP